MAAVSNNPWKEIKANINQWIDCLPEKERKELLINGKLNESGISLFSNFTANNNSLISNLREKLQNHKTNDEYKIKLTKDQNSANPKTKAAALILGNIVPPKMWRNYSEDIMQSIRKTFDLHEIIEKGKGGLEPKDVALVIRKGSLLSLEKLTNTTIQGQKQLPLSPAEDLIVTIYMNNKELIKNLRAELPQFRKEFNDYLKQLYDNETTRPYAYILDYLVESGAYMPFLESSPIISCSIQ